MQALILDSNAADYAPLAEDLNQAGFATVVVTTVLQARQELIGQRFDLVLLESTLPDGDGLRLCNEIRCQFGDDMLIIFVSEYDTPARRAVSLQLGADDFVGKPVARDELLARIEARYRRRTDYQALHTRV